MATLEDHERRITALEEKTQSEETIVRAASEIVSESEKRVRQQMQGVEKEVANLRTDMAATEARITDSISAAQRATSSELNDFKQEILAAIDKLANPPK